MRARLSALITFDERAYAEAYGLESAEVASDCETYLEGGVQDLLQEHLGRLDWGAKVDEIHASIDDRPVTAHESRNGLPTGFEHTALADLVAVNIALTHKIPAILIGGVLLRLQNELKRRNPAAVTSAYEQYWATADGLGLGDRIRRD